LNNTEGWEWGRGRWFELLAKMLTKFTSIPLYTFKQMISPNPASVGLSAVGDVLVAGTFWV
jgi:hypothetical protein